MSDFFVNHVPPGSFRTRNLSHYKARGGPVRRRKRQKIPAQSLRSSTNHAIEIANLRHKPAVQPQLLQLANALHGLNKPAANHYIH